MSHIEEPKVTEDEEPPTEQDKRKKMLALKDPVHTVSLQQFIYEKLKAQQELLGEQGFQSLMETVDTEIVTQLQEFLQGFWEHVVCGWGTQPATRVREPAERMEKSLVCEKKDAKTTLFTRKFSK